MSKPRDERQKDLFRPPLDQIIDLAHPLAQLAGQIDWQFIEQRLGSVYQRGPGQPPLPIRLIAGLMILKHMHSLSDEVLCATDRLSCKSAVSCSSPSRWRQRVKDDRSNGSSCRNTCSPHRNW